MAVGIAGEGDLGDTGPLAGGPLFDQLQRAAERPPRRGGVSPADDHQAVARPAQRFIRDSTSSSAARLSTSPGRKMRHRLEALGPHPNCGLDDFGNRACRRRLSDRSARVPAARRAIAVNSLTGGVMTPSEAPRRKATICSRPEGFASVRDARR